MHTYTCALIFLRGFILEWTGKTKQNEKMDKIS